MPSPPPGAPGLEPPPDPRAFWAQVLSSDPVRVREAMASLSEGERTSVVEHLQRMASEPGWQDGQRGAARAALDILHENPPLEEE